MIRPDRLLASALRLVPGAAPVVSRAASPDLLILVGGHRQGIIAPTVRGVTVWSAIDASGPVVAVVEDPNWLGSTESHPVVPFIAARRDEPGVGWAQQTRAARKLAKTLGQIPGVWPAHAGVAPWFTVGTPIRGDRIVTAAAESGIVGLTALGDRFPGIPGGVRIAPPAPLPAAWAASCVASVRRAIDQEMGRP